MLYYKDIKLKKKKTKEKIIKNNISKYLKRTVEALVISGPIIV